MSSDHSTVCASSPRGGGVGLCKALKEMKTKVATHTGMSLSFVELVATSPVISLLPALPPSPRNPSALLHRHMHLHSNYTFVARRSSSTEQSTCVDMETMGRQSTEATQSSCATAAIDGDSRLQIKLSCVPMPYNVSYGCLPSTCQVCQLSCENPLSCDLSCGHPLSSSSACSLTCGHQSSSSSSCNLSFGQPSSSSSCVLLCWEPLSSSISCSCHVSCVNPSSYSSCNLHPLSSSSTCNLHPSSSSSTCNLSTRHPSSSSVTCNSYLSSSSSTCNSPCQHPSSSSSFDLSCGHSSSSSSCDLSCCHQWSSSSSSLSSSCDLSSGHPSSSSCVFAKLVSADASPADKLSSNNLDCCNTLRTSSTGMCKHATTILRVKSKIPSTSARVLYFIVTVIFALSSISKGFYRSCLWGGNISRRVLHPRSLMHYIRVMISAGSFAMRKDGGHGNEMEGVKLDVSEGQQSLQGSKTSCIKRSKLLKSKLRSSFKSLSVQVPRKIFAPRSSSSPLSSSSLSSSSPLSSNSPGVNGSPTARKTRTLRSPTFARKLTKSFNQREPCTVSEISPVLPLSRMRSLPMSQMVCPHPSSCEFKQHSPNSLTSLNKLGDSMVAPLVALPLALCALFYGKLVAFSAVTAWLLIVSIASSVLFPWRAPSQICSPR